jgi:cell wall-associated NlpC family hydrolase
MPNRNELMIAARSMVGTPFIHQGRVPGVGLDCAGFGIETCKAVGISIGDMESYSKQPDGRSLLKHLNKTLLPIEIGRALPGDVLIMYFKRSPQHIAMLAELNGRRTIIHACLLQGKVVEQTINEEIIHRIVRAYSIPGIE